MAKKIGVLGSGTVGQILADAFLRRGHEVMRGSREPDKLAGWKQTAGERASTGTFAQTAAFGETLVLAVKGTAAEEVIAQAGLANLAGKTILDTTNPIADRAPEQGVLGFFTTFDQSLMERLQKQAPDAHFVKAFSSVGGPQMDSPKLPGGPPTMFICGNDEGAKSEARDILAAFGWETEDMGSVVAARAIEPLCILWCIPGFARNQWGHAFKLLKP